MGKLKDMIQEETLADRLTGGANRIRLASLGLIKRVEREGNKLFDELVEAGHGDVADNRIACKIDAARRGAITRIRDEAKKIIDELVELGEEASIGTSASAKPVTTFSAPQLAKTASTALKQKAAEVKADTTSEPVASAAAPVDIAPVEDETLNNAFKSAQARVKTLKSAPDMSSMATLYALYKQASEGDVNGKRPGLTEPVERAKFDARKKLKGVTSAEAKQQYIELVDSLVGARA